MGISGHIPDAGAGNSALGHRLGFVLPEPRNRHSLTEAEKQCVGGRRPVHKMVRKVDLEKDRKCGCFGGPKSQSWWTASAGMRRNVLQLSLQFSSLYVTWLKIPSAGREKLIIIATIPCVPKATRQEPALWVTMTS